MSRQTSPLVVHDMTTNCLWLLVAELQPSGRCLPVLRHALPEHWLAQRLQVRVMLTWAMLKQLLQK